MTVPGRSAWQKNRRTPSLSEGNRTLGCSSYNPRAPCAAQESPAVRSDRRRERLDYRQYGGRVPTEFRRGVRPLPLVLRRIRCGSCATVASGQSQGLSPKRNWPNEWPLARNSAECWAVSQSTCSAPASGRAATTVRPI